MHFTLNKNMLLPLPPKIIIIIIIIIEGKKLIYAKPNRNFQDLLWFQRINAVLSQSMKGSTWMIPVKAQHGLANSCKA